MHYHKERANPSSFFEFFTVLTFLGLNANIGNLVLNNVYGNQ